MSGACQVGCWPLCRVPLQCTTVEVLADMHMSVTFPIVHQAPVPLLLLSEQYVWWLHVLVRLLLALLCTAASLNCCSSWCPECSVWVMLTNMLSKSGVVRGTFLLPVIQFDIVLLLRIQKEGIAFSRYHISVQVASV